MGLSSVLSTAITGLQASETTIDVAGNNVANANTVGFKASEAVFATQFLQTLSLGSAPTAGNAGTNPRQIGLGTQVVGITPDFTQGTLEISSNPSDLAIQGDGFFIVQSSAGEQLYSRNGKFQINAQNELVSANGDRLLGFGVDDNFDIQTTSLRSLSIPLGAAAVARATQSVFMEGTLTPTGDLADTPEIIQSSILSDGSLEVPADYNASNVSAIGAPAAPDAAVDAGAGSIEAGTYIYKVVFVDNNGFESPPSTGTTSVVLSGGAGSQAVALSNIPVSGAAEFNTKRIYRSDDTGPNPVFHFVDEIPNAQTSYTDTTAEATVGTNATLNESTLSPGTYEYFITYRNSSNGLESRPTSVIQPPALTIPGQRLRLDNLVGPSSGDFDQIRIYRNVPSVDASKFYLVSTIPGATTSFIDGATDASINVPANEINLDGPPISPGLKLVDIVRRNGTSYEKPFVPGTLSFAGRKGGRTLENKELQVTNNSTVQDLIEFMTQALGIQKSSPGDLNPIPGSPGATIAGGRIQLTGNNGENNAIEIGLSSMQLLPTGATASTQVNLQFGTVQTAKGQSAVADFIAFDSLGIPLNVRVTAVLEARTGTQTTYRWFADSPANDPASGVNIAVGTGLVNFDGQGKFLSTSNSTISIDRINVPSASPLEIKMDFTQISGLSADTPNLAVSRQDGFPPGKLTSFIVGEDGVIRGVFDNGTERDLGQIRLARFANARGLEQRGQNLYASGVNSGLPVQSNPGQQGIGAIVAGAVELSNTDIGENLIDLILASTQYRGNARVITASQQLLEELLNLRR